ncbi:DUF4157 domain-containing protein [Chitinophaga sp. GbtcB8]|uniref:eCIS core domain-containing protein n=1 Tax=Chitinophaga sp. GbtcB8 TaxID=2824753 RepID=UPI001C30EBD8|nr:DUF4157 domain-containing protein [Chitinophaga sp. GbtcB8]
MPEHTTISIPQQQTPAAHAPAQGDALRMQNPGFIQRKCADCEEEDAVQRKPITPFVPKKEAGSGRYAPESSGGQHLLAHELTHTLQQSSGQGIQRMIEVSSGVELDTMGYSIKKSANFYTAPAVNKSSVHNELVTSLFHSPRIFKLKGNTSAAANASLRKQMAARMGIISFAAKKQYSFGAGAGSFKMNPDYWVLGSDNFNVKPGVDKTKAINDLNVHPEQYAIACEAATALTMVGGSKSPVINDDGGDDTDWIPGDWGYIHNQGNMDHGGNTATEGENIIYVGLGKYWGHLGSGLKYQTLPQWVKEVDDFNGGTPSIEATRKGPTIGLDTGGSDGEVTDIK